MAENSVVSLLSFLKDPSKLGTNQIQSEGDEARSRLLSNGLPKKGNELWKNSSATLILSKKIDQILHLNENARQDVSSKSEIIINSDKAGEVESGVIALKLGLYPRQTAASSDSNSHPMKVSNLSFSKLLQNFELKSNDQFLFDLAQVYGGSCIEISVSKSADINVELINNGPAGSAIFPIIFLKIDSGASVSVNKTFSGNGRCLVFPFFFIKSDSDSKVEIRDTSEINSENTYFYNKIYALNAGAELTEYGLNIGNGYIRNSMNVDLCGKQASFKHFLGSLIDSSSHVELNSTIRHLVPETFSSQEVRGIIKGNGKSIFKGMVEIVEDAQLSNAKQLSKTLLMSDTGVSISEPQLRINADDVKASHGTTTGQLNKDELFYLTSRGFSADLATKILSRAFLESVFDSDSDQTMKGKLTKSLDINYE